MAAETVVEATGVAMRFGGVNAVDGVSMRLARHELRCLIGPNGAGKSTFFKCLSGQYRPTEGDIQLAGESIVGLEKHDIAQRGVGVKTQVPSLMNALTVHENLWLAARAVRSRSAAAVKARVGELIDALDLGPIVHRPTGLLAHGQRQVVELGVVLAPDPWLVLLDEPAGGLTRSEVERMAELVTALAARATVVVVEHDMNFVRRIAHAVTVFHQGRILTEGPAAQVLADDRVRDVYLGKRR
ncbi:ATP-binding cassette domain-containing protein [Variovorax boronicumulans]|uniref:ATP-binding cassette domain-containing protein n=1 Tax=Variovorax boronicumulans TaxID=436515 RepID=UPI001C58074C